MSFGVHWSTKKLKHFSSNINQLRTESSLKKECQKIKWFISSLASYLVGFSNSIDLVEKQLLDDNGNYLEISIFFFNKNIIIKTY